MEDIRFGRAIRAARVKRRWRQEDLASRAGVSAAGVWRVERGRLEEMTLRAIRGICAPLDIRVELTPRGRGADLDRIVNAGHSALHESVARALAREFPDWQMAHEVSFNIWGERGVIDLLMWHPGRRALLIVELKTEIVDTGELIATADRRRRLGAQIVRDRDWDPLTVSTWVLVASSRTNERRIADHRSVLRSAFPDDGRRVHRWLADPSGSIDALSSWSGGDVAAAASTRRVRRRTVA
ncbi:MAG TPA: helix-turn-helix domain-containing protein [Candidatus Limnocylindrales bacterium]|nr:helix-turn-helix domain-containing protein [Candidatus Limnocylindrales bacterium]